MLQGFPKRSSRFYRFAETIGSLSRMLAIHCLSHFRKDGKAALDHRLGGGERDAKVIRNLHDAARQHEHITIRQGIPDLLAPPSGYLQNR